ncbi:thiamine pyrophosphate-binding protein [Arthrobacter subterraneus]|uniref:thiamine pyrophosphate-binding protein n=1 Tax=Arthrobacter subterraneus TaxID=335973 RepID=UPI003808F21F
MTALGTSSTGPQHAFGPDPLVSEVVAGVLHQRAAATYGVMGNGNAFVVGSLFARAHRYVKARHEAGAMSMAQGHYLATGNPAAVTTTYGPGYTNTLTVLAEAFIARTPIVLVVGQAPSSSPRPFDIDQTAAAAAMGVQTLTVGRNNVESLTHRAFDLAERDLVPVVLSIPYDLAEVPATEQLPIQPLKSHEVKQPSEQDISSIAELLAGAERPLLIAGRGALLSGAGSAIEELGDKLGALFATSVMARHLVSSEWDLGIAGGFSTPGAAELMRAADVVLVLGASMNTYQMRYGTLLQRARAIVQVDQAPSPTNDIITHFAQADARLFAEALASRVHEASRQTWRDEVPGVADRSIHVPEELPERGPDGRVNPRALAIRLNEILPRDRTIVQDGGHFLGWLAMYAEVPDPYALQHPGLPFHSIGMGFPTALGAALARPERFTLLTCGDGGGMMALADLETLVREAPRVLIIVFNDSAYGMEVHQYAARGISAQPMVFDEVNFAAVGAALGARSLTVTDLAQLDEVSEWIASEEPGAFLVDVKISPSFVAEYVTEKVAFDEAQR